MEFLMKNKQPLSNHYGTWNLGRLVSQTGRCLQNIMRVLPDQPTFEPTSFCALKPKKYPFSSNPYILPLYNKSMIT